MIDDVFTEVCEVRDGGGKSRIIGRNTSERPKVRPLDLLNKIHLDKD